jgi:hypothetical protein
MNFLSMLTEENDLYQIDRLIAMNNTPYHKKVDYLYKLQEKMTFRTDSLTLMKLWINVSTKMKH